MRTPFYPLGESYGRDRRYTYWQGRIVEGAGTDGFRVIDESFAVDGCAVYRYGARIGADPASFEPLSLGYCRDAEHVFFQGRVIEGIDPETAEVLDEHYIRDAIRIYYLDHPLTDADRNSFEIIGNHYGRDKAHIFSSGRVLPQADYRSFTVVPAPYPGADYGKDCRRVYYFGNLIPGADPDNFVGLGYSSDGLGVFLGSDELPRADPESLRIEYRGWSHDAGQVFLDAEPVAGLFPDGFEVINDNYVRDRRSVFYYDSRMMILEPIAGADPASFEVLSDPYSRDRGQVYFLEKAVDGANPGSFEILRYGWARDVGRFYYYGTPVSYHGGSFEIIDSFFCKDNRCVYFPGEVQPVIDAETFEKRTDFFYVDRDRVWMRATPLQVSPEEARFIGSCYLVAEDGVFFLEAPLPGADPESFEVMNYSESRDRFRVYTFAAGRVVTLGERTNQ